MRPPDCGYGHLRVVPRVFLSSKPTPALQSGAVSPDLGFSLPSLPPEAVTHPE